MSSQAHIRLGATMALLSSALLACGPGLVAASGDESASSTGTGGDCVATTDAEICDGIDNDCDGSIDEDIAPLVCGVGSCATSVHCEAGQMLACVPKDPQPETCNLADDDCDGEVDEGLGFGPLADRVVLRTDEFNTGTCTSCSWAWGTTLAPTNNGFLALWNLGLSGGSRQPTLYGRFVDGAGAPTGPVELLRADYFVTMYPMPALEPMPPMGLPLAVVHRSASDVSGLLYAGTDGTTELFTPIPGSGPQNVERTVWTGQRVVTVWEENDELRIAILHADGSLDQMLDVDPLERAASITLGVFPGRVGVLVSRVRVELELWDQWFVTLDSLGNVVTPAHEIDVEYESWQRLVGTEIGWLHIRPNGFDEPSTRQSLDPDGDPVNEASPFADARHIGDSGLADTFVPRPGLNEMITAWGDPNGGDMHVEFLDGHGDVLRGWSGPLEPDPGYDQGHLVSPHVRFLDDRALVIWHGLSEDAAPNRVYVRSFGCAP